CLLCSGGPSQVFISLVQVVHCVLITSITVTWKTVPSAESYCLEVYSQDTGEMGTTEGSCNVTGLACGQIYHVSVVSSDGYCNSPPTPVTDTPSGRTKVTDRYIKNAC
uniref:Fibronectin type-III domain-containing protein n=1 Tax=Amphiprion percula TaxID=161767 RepID=A0A3P8T8U9_AMPPE